MTSAMDNIAALGELTRVGAALAQTQQQPNVPPPVATPPGPQGGSQGTGTPSPTTASGAEPARELVGAITNAL
eukprot:76652-Pyramimonas_sp.AAC.1